MVFVHTMLLDVALPQGIFVNAGAFQEFLVDSSKLLDPYCGHGDLMKKFILICTDGGIFKCWV